jgi:carboxymethylenebutenolidase
VSTAGPVTLATGDGPMPGYQARPDGAAKGGVVVVQEAFGVNPHIEDVTRRFATAGWDAVAPAFFHRQGSPVLDYDDLATVMPLLGQLTPGGLAMDLAAAVGHLAGAGHPAGRVAVVGHASLGPNFLSERAGVTAAGQMVRATQRHMVMSSPGMSW